MADLKSGKIRSAVPENSKKRFIKHISLVVAATVALALTLLLFTSHDASSTKAPLEEVVAFATPQPDVVTIPIKGKDTFYSLLSEFDVPPAEIIAMTRAAKGVYDLRRINAGSALTITTLEGELRKVEYRYADLEALVLERSESDGAFSASTVEIPHAVVPTLASGTIDRTLYAAAIDAGIGTDLITELSDIFAWDVDFTTEIRKGDTFKVLYEKILIDGEEIATGKILGAVLVNRGKRITAIYYSDSKGRERYYNEEGKSLSRQLLKSPLRYRRISSYFTRKRWHPILKKYRPHHGVDYAAPTGTPVESAGSGRVVSAGWKSGYGKVVTIRHNGTYTTVYGHLSRFAKGIKRGSRVKQGQLIGYVGSTGLSTGPHLHYELKINGRLVNPLSIKPLPSKSIAKDERERFKAVMGEIMAQFSTEDDGYVKVADARAKLQKE
ncbi:MAG: M23 family metallopeptidase [Thermodesulfobacteriota bacterium]